MLRKERKWNPIKRSIKNREGWKGEEENKRSKWKAVTNMTDINPAEAMTSLYLSGLRPPIKRWRPLEQIEKKKTHYMLSIRDPP